jgi:hypothetical protein
VNIKGYTAPLGALKNTQVRSEHSGMDSQVRSENRGIHRFVVSYCPLPPPDLCEKSWGYHCRELQWRLASLAKLIFFSKIKRSVASIEGYTEP